MFNVQGTYLEDRQNPRFDNDLNNTIIFSYFSCGEHKRRESTTIDRRWGRWRRSWSSHCRVGCSPFSQETAAEAKRYVATKLIYALQEVYKSACTRQYLYI